MSTVTRNNRIDYIELTAPSDAALAQARKFYGDAFGWEYKGWGPAYADTQSSGVASGIGVSAPSRTLAVIYANDLEAAKARVLAAGGVLVKDIFSFPGGRRFHFKDPAGNELAVWSDVGGEKL